MSEPAEVFQRGDFVTATAGDRTVEAMVTLASPCGKSLIIMFDAMLDGHAGAMPLLYGEGGFLSIVTGRPVTLVRKERPS